MMTILFYAIENQQDCDFIIELYQDYYGLMRKHALSMLQDEDAAEDAVQTACVRLIQKVDTLRGLRRCVLPSYLISTIQNVCINFLRQRGRVQAVEWPTLQEDWFPELRDLDADVERQVLLRLDVERLQQCLRQLPVQYRDLLNLKYLLELSDAEIAAQLGMRKDSVRQALTRARRKALQMLEEDGDENR